MHVNVSEINFFTQAAAPQASGFRLAAWTFVRPTGQQPPAALMRSPQTRRSCVGGVRRAAAAARITELAELVRSDGADIFSVVDMATGEI